MSSMYRKTYYCLCEGQQEKMYLEHLSSLLKTDSRKVTFNCVLGDAENLYRYKSYEPEKVVLFDHDGKQENFEKQIRLCTKNNAHMAYSNLNFDLWLVLHSEDFKGVGPAQKNDAYKEKVRKFYRLAEDADIKQKKIIEKILKQINLESVKKAIHNAEKIRRLKTECEKHRVGDCVWYDNPDFSIDVFLRNALENAGEEV